MKKVWKKPELNVFVKGSVEESVLGSCKSNGLDNGGPLNNNCYSGDSGNLCKDSGYGVY